MKTIVRLFLAVALTAAGLAPAAAQYAPPGSYQQSCRHVRVEGNQLMASCRTSNGGFYRTSIPIGACRGGDIANVNGSLQCGQQYGGGGGYRPGYGGGQNLPGGSYLSSCTNAFMRGPMLVASCTASNGSRNQTSIDPNRCRPGTDVANINGQLVCLYYR